MCDMPDTSAVPKSQSKSPIASSTDQPKQIQQPIPETFDAKSYYTWSNFFSSVLGINSLEDQKRYVHARSIINEAADCTRCEKWRDWLLQNSPIVRFLTDNVDKLGPGEPPVPTQQTSLSEAEQPARVPLLGAHNIICARCNTIGASLRRAGFSPQHGVLLCANHIESRSQMEDALAHELVHAYDHMRFAYDRTSIKHAACTEIRAAMLSGECRWTREFFTNGQWGSFVGHFQDCVKRKATASVKMHEKFKGLKEPERGEQAKAAVESVWESCFADTRPFDEIYR